MTMKHAGFTAGLVASALVITALSTVSAQAGPRGGMKEMPSFETLDTDGNGEVTKAEMKAHRESKFTKADKDGDGKLNAEEVKAMAQARAAERAGKMFERADENKDGFISKDEMPKGRKGDKMFNRIDDDGNGSISKAEYDAMKDRMKEGGWKKRKGCDKG